jgi:hypothetical protein
LVGGAGLAQHRRSPRAPVQAVQVEVGADRLILITDPDPHSGPMARPHRQQQPCAPSHLEQAQGEHQDANDAVSKRGVACPAHPHQHKADHCQQEPGDLRAIKVPPQQRQGESSVERRAARAGLNGACAMAAPTGCHVHPAWRAQAAGFHLQAAVQREPQRVVSVRVASVARHQHADRQNYPPGQAHE